MVLHVIHALERPAARARPSLVVGHGAEQVTKKVQELAPAWANVVFVEQADQRGTGDAAAIGMTAFPGDDLDDDSTIVVLPGDTPLLRPETLDELVATHVANGNAATLLTSVVDDPTGYGRVIRAQRRAGRCASSSSATPSPEELADRRGRHEHLRLPPRPARPGAAPPLARQRAGRVLPHRRRRRARRDGPPRRVASQAPAEETQGVNDRWQLALAERELRSRTNRHWLLNGVTMLDPRQTFIDVTVRLGRDVTLYPGTILAGQHRRRRRLRDRPGHPPRRLRGRARTAVIQHTVGLEAEIGDGRPGRAVRPPARRARTSPRARRPAPSTLHPRTESTSRSTGRRPMEKVTTKKLALYSGRTHPELADGGRRRTSASSSATRTSSSSPTARSGRASPRASAATTCSSCRATTASTAARSTTRSWSS